MTAALKTEEKPAHTPGPWRVGAGNGEGSIFCAEGRMTFSKKGTTLHPICNMVDGPMSFHAVGEAEDEANARLIAAAPCMLEALRNLVMDWERVIGPIPEDHEAQVAIAKAEGGAA